jgi:hypothetical protein
MDCPDCVGDFDATAGPVPVHGIRPVQFILSVRMVQHLSERSIGNELGEERKPGEDCIVDVWCCGGPFVAHHGLNRRGLDRKISNVDSTSAYYRANNHRGVLAE